MSITVTTELILNEIEFYFLELNNKPDNFSMWMFVATSWKKKEISLHSLTYLSPS